MKKWLITAAITLIVLAAYARQVAVGSCDFRLSQFLGYWEAIAVAGVFSFIAVLGITLKAKGFYAITHAHSGAKMLGSRDKGNNAAGVKGIIANTDGPIGTGGAFFLSLFVIVGAIMIVVGIAAYEYRCYQVWVNPIDRRYGVKKDPVRGLMWLNIAVSNGNKKAKSLVKSIREVFSSLQVVEAENLAEEWMRKNQQQKR